MNKQKIVCITLRYFFPAYCDGHLLVFSETHLDVFNTQTAEWVQSIGLKRSRPLSLHGNIATTFINDSPILIYFANMHTRKGFVLFTIRLGKKFDHLFLLFSGELLNTFAAGDRDGRVKPKRRFSLRESNNRAGART